MSQHRYILRNVPAHEWRKWDQFIDGHPGGHFLQSWGWGELKASTGWYPFRLFLWDEEQQQVVAAAQVLRRTASALPSWAGSLAYIPKGPVIDWSDPMLCRAFFTQLNAYLHARGALALRMSSKLNYRANSGSCYFACMQRYICGVDSSSSIVSCSPGTTCT